MGADPPHAADPLRRRPAAHALPRDPAAHRPQHRCGEFILRRLAEDPDLVAIFEANGGANVIGRAGLLELAKFVVLLEEGAQYQAIAETLGGSVEFDPSNLAVQWGRTGLADEARRRGLL